MKAKNCKAIRQQIDEANLDDHLPLEAAEHLRNCSDCRRFHDERCELLALMAGLETIGAPADFDFRLRARLARERSRNGVGSFLVSARPLAVVALLVLIAVGAVVVRNRMSPAPPAGRPFQAVVPVNMAPLPGVGGPILSAQVSSRPETPSRKASDAHPEAKQLNATVSRAAVAQRVSSSAGTRNAVNPGTREFGLGTAPVLTPGTAEGSLVVVPVDARAFKVSIDNGRGGARTISLPPVSFGSQRLLAREASFVPASRSDW